MRGRINPIAYRLGYTYLWDNIISPNYYSNQLKASFFIFSLAKSTLFETNNFHKKIVFFKAYRFSYFFISNSNLYLYNISRNKAHSGKHKTKTSKLSTLKEKVVSFFLLRKIYFLVFLKNLYMSNTKMKEKNFFKLILKQNKLKPVLESLLALDAFKFIANRKEFKNNFNISCLSLIFQAAHLTAAHLVKDLKKSKNQKGIIYGFQSVLRAVMTDVIFQDFLEGFTIGVKGKIQKKRRKSKLLLQIGKTAVQTVDLRVSYSLKHVTTKAGVLSISIWFNSYRLQK
jgi:hypothetical protein